MSSLYSQMFPITSDPYSLIHASIKIFKGYKCQAIWSLLRPHTPSRYRARNTGNCVFGVNQSITARKLNDTLATLKCADMSEHMPGKYGQFLTKWECIRDATGDLWVTIAYSWASNKVWKWLWPLSSHDMDISWLCSALSEDHTLICL